MNSFDPKSKKYPYPEYTDSHYIKIKKNKGIIFDDKYPYIDKSKGFKFKQGIIRFLLFFIVFRITWIVMGLKINGKKNFKKNKDIIKKGVISCSNHIHYWDYIAIMKLLWPIHPYTIVWDKNVNGENGFLVRMVGGIPIPNNPKAATSFLRALKKHLDDSGHIHIYGEGSMWEYYYPIRPFKRGVAYYAVKFDKPILPLSFSYRKPSWFRKHILRQEAAITLNVGDLIYKDDTIVDKVEKEDELLRRCHKEICKLSGIDNNIYPYLFNDTKRIDYY